MLVTLLDGEGVPHLVTWQGQDPIVDFSGTLASGTVGVGAAFQQIATANPLRAGWLFQNTSQNAMLLCEIAAPLVASSWVINPGEAFPPPGFPIPTTAISVIGSSDSVAGDAFAYREWQNAANE